MVQPQRCWRRARRPARRCCRRRRSSRRSCGPGVGHFSGGQPDQTGRRRTPTASCRSCSPGRTGRSGCTSRFPSSPRPRWPESRRRSGSVDALANARARRAGEPAARRRRSALAPVAVRAAGALHRRAGILGGGLHWQVGQPLRPHVPVLAVDTHTGPQTGGLTGTHAQTEGEPSNVAVRVAGDVLNVRADPPAIGAPAAGSQLSFGSSTHLPIPGRRSRRSPAASRTGMHLPVVGSQSLPVGHRTAAHEPAPRSTMSSCL